jgi:hypothetical protein
MATLASAIMMREMRAFIRATYQPLVMVSGATVILLRGSRDPYTTKTDQTFWVGRLHYLLHLTLSAHFR